MRTLPLTALPFLLLFSVAAHAEVFKCTINGKVEYRDSPCAGSATQEVIEFKSDVLNAPPTDAAAVLAQLRQADQALSDRLQQERLQRMQIAARQAQLDQQERIAMETRETEENDYAVPLVGGYWPFVAFNHHHFGRRFHNMGNFPPHQFRHHGGNRNSFGARAPMRAGSFAANLNF